MKILVKMEESRVHIFLKQKGILFPNPSRSRPHYTSCISFVIILDKKEHFLLLEWTETKQRDSARYSR